MSLTALIPYNINEQNICKFLSNYGSHQCFLLVYAIYSRKSSERYVAIYVTISLRQMRHESLIGISVREQIAIQETYNTSQHEIVLQLHIQRRIPRGSRNIQLNRKQLITKQKVVSFKIMAYIFARKFEVIKLLMHQPRLKHP